MRTKPGGTPARFLVGLLFLLLSIELAFVFLRARPLLSWPAELVNPNGVCVSIAERVMKGGPVYTDWREPPYSVSQYGPLFYWLPARLGRWSGADGFRLFGIGRGISLICTLGTALLLFGASARRARGAVPGALAALVFLTATANFPAGFDFRPDAAVVFLTVAGLLLLRGEAGGAGRSAAALGLFLGAFLFKQSAIVGPAAVVLHRLLSGRIRAAVRFGLVALLLFAGTAAIATAATGGLYWSNAVGGLASGLRPKMVPGVAFGACRWNVATFATALVLGGAALMRRRPSLEVTAFLASGLFALLVSARIGSAANYYVEPLALGLLVVGGAWAGFRAGSDAVPRAVPGAVPRAVPGAVPRAVPRVVPRAVVLVLGVFVAAHAARAARMASTLPATLALYRDREQLASTARREILATVRRARDLAGGAPVLCQDGSLAMHLRGAGPVMDWFLTSELVRLGRFPGAGAIERKIREGGYGAIVLTRPPDGEPGEYMYQGVPYLPRPWLAAMRDPGGVGWRKVEEGGTLAEVGARLHAPGPIPFRFWGSPTPHLQIFVPVSR